MNRIENIYLIQTYLYRLAITGLVITWLVITSRVYACLFDYVTSFIIPLAWLVDHSSIH